MHIRLCSSHPRKYSEASITRAGTSYSVPAAAPVRLLSCSMAGERPPAIRTMIKMSLLQHVTVYKVLPQLLSYHNNPSEAGTRIPIVTHSDISCPNDAAQPSSKQQSGGLGRAWAWGVPSCDHPSHLSCPPRVYTGCPPAFTFSG